MSHGTERVGRGSDLSRLDVNVRSWYFCAGDRLGSSEVAGTAGIVRAGNGAGHRRSTVHDAVRGLPTALLPGPGGGRSEEHTSELQSRFDLVCRLLLEQKN